MELYLQLGHKMMGYCQELFQKSGGGTVILSPRDLSAKQIDKLSASLKKVHGKTLLDPQFYDPRCDHKRLTSHEYWPSVYSTSLLMSDSTYLNCLLTKIADENKTADTVAYIVPGIYCDKADEVWFSVQEIILKEAVTVMSDKPRLATICLSADVLRDEDAIEDIISRVEKWNVSGYYVIAEHPHGRYLVDDPLWLGNLLSFCAGLKLQQKQVIAGYCSHQMLSLASANVDAIASGSFLNVRSFPMDKFNTPDEDSTSRRATWYYCPHALSEYKLPFLDAAKKVGILSQLAPDSALSSDYADILFSGAQPSTTNFKDRLAFLHYLQSLHSQCKTARRKTFQETLDAHTLQLTTAETHIKVFQQHGIRGQDRDFKDYIDVNRSALIILEKVRKFVLSKKW